ncbi:hypothetical protein CDD81_4563 [Ophiocordyceps australis]|uniref:FAD dependent oxidoreductase domain-containing protein n=1 Tax=Ophiocordyceps australis TaxID=1399860 RepID=A0A2C5XJ42_9HYPO|nr:hypothetical protein CDD81_4563 [Ophiocordyceps australis]
MATVVVIGAGVVGLSTAVKLQRLGQGRYGIVVIARDWPPSTPGAAPSHSADYASMWAGAHVRPIPATTAQLRREAALMRRTVAEFAALEQGEAQCGITRTTGVEMLEEPDEGYRRLDGSTFARETGLEGFKTIEGDSMPEGVQLGFEYQTFCINPGVYCQFLVRQLLEGGAKTLQRELGSEWEAFGAGGEVLFVVNASGMGFGDAQCFPTRGQTLVTNMAHVSKTVTRQNRDGSWAFLVPRFMGGGTIVGGTKEAHDWRTEPDAATRQRLLAAGRELEPYACDTPPPPGWELSVVADVVGRRPTRAGGLRLDVETDLEGRSVVHAYGAGGRGYELSWGIASEVVRLAEPLINRLPIVGEH